MSLRRNILWNLLPVAQLAVVGLGANVVIARWRGPDALGVFNQVTTAYFVATVIGACGIPLALLRAVAAAAHANDDVRIAELTAAAVTMAAVTGAVVALALAAVASPLGVWWASPASGEGLLWVAPGVWCFVINKVLLAVVNGRGRMRAFALYTSLRYLMLGVGLGVVLALSTASALLGAVWPIAEGVLLVALIAETAWSLPWRSATQRWREHRASLWGYGWRSMPATLGVELNSRIDVWVLGALTSDAAVGVYSLAATVADGMLQFAVLVQNNLSPTLVTAPPQELPVFMNRVRRWFMPLFVSGCGVAAVVYTVGAPRIAGATFADGGRAFITLMVGWSVASFYLPFAQVLVLRGRPHTHSAIVYAGMAFNIAATWLLFTRLGIVAAAVGASASAVAQMVATRYCVSALLGVPANHPRRAAANAEAQSAHTTNQ